MTFRMAAGLTLLSICASAMSVAPAPYRVSAHIPDVAELAPLSQVRLDGYLGRRAAVSEKNRLLEVNEDELLSGFRHRPGSQAWIGEHVGKWLHAATLAWVNDGDPALKAKMDRVVAGLLETQEPDGYLGTYAKNRRFGLYPDADWDVWVHKYDLIGLLTYYRYAKNPAALEASKRIGDLLIATFGPGRKSINDAGTQAGMAATSVLEPMVLLYRTTGEKKYLDFALYIIKAYDEPNGPKIIAALDDEKTVRKAGNGKAYEMLSNLVGLCELARATGNRSYLTPVFNAWKDITAHQLYLTGTASYREFFHENDDLPNRQGMNVGETCVTVTWIQLNAQLLRLTGDARYGNELERSYYNHLAAAQRPDGAQWCYYTSLEGKKPYTATTCCCLSSGPRGMAMAPEIAYLKSEEGGRDVIAANWLETSTFRTRIAGHAVTLSQRSSFPREGVSILTVRTGAPVKFGLKVRAPEWAKPMKLAIVGTKRTLAVSKGGWLEIPARTWKSGDRVRIAFHLALYAVKGTHGNVGKTALMWGPFVLAFDESRNPKLSPARSLVLADWDKSRFIEKHPTPYSPIAFRAYVRAYGQKVENPAVLVPFAEAGNTGGAFRIWLYSPKSPGPSADSLFAYGEESQSREGNRADPINDGDPGTYSVTFNGQPSDRDWFALSLDQPATFGRVVFVQGQTFHDGGWYDASAGKPRIEIQREKGGTWEDLGALTTYPETTAIDSKGLSGGESFELRLEKPVTAFALRVIGHGASGDNPNESFASCGELQAYP